MNSKILQSMQRCFSQLQFCAHELPTPKLSFNKYICVYICIYIFSMLASELLCELTGLPLLPTPKINLQNMGSIHLKQCSSFSPPHRHHFPLYFHHSNDHCLSFSCACICLHVYFILSTQNVLSPFWILHLKSDTDRLSVHKTGDEEKGNSRLFKIGRNHAINLEIK